MQGPTMFKAEFKVVQKTPGDSRAGKSGGAAKDLFPGVDRDTSGHARLNRS